jgi:ATP-binding cassette subfamily F protein uup
VFEGEGKIRLFNGNYSDYRLWADGQTPEEEDETPVMVEAKSETTKKRLNFKEKQELIACRPKFKVWKVRKPRFLNN